jgi:hypothetical protein
MAKKIPATEMLGRRFGRLVVEAEAPRTSHDRWRVVCDCGDERVVFGPMLRSGKTGSCGCLRREVQRAHSVTHGATAGRKRSPEWSVWAGMKRRCLSPSVKAFTNYGGRGVRVCARWLDSFEAFLADMGPRPSLKHSIDRVDVDGDYEPGNCRWATAREQGAHMRKNTAIRVGDEWLPVPAASERLGLSRCAIYSRVHRGDLESRLLSEVQK